MPSYRKLLRAEARKEKKLAKAHKKHRNALDAFVTNYLKLKGADIHLVKIQSDLAVKRCHDNCEDMMKHAAQRNSKIVTCWIIRSSNEIIADAAAYARVGHWEENPFDNTDKPRMHDFDAEFHSILQRGNGTFYDPTKDRNPDKKNRLIVLEPRMTSENFCKYVNYQPPLIQTKDLLKIRGVQGKGPDFFELLTRMNLIKKNLW